MRHTNQCNIAECQWLRYAHEMDALADACSAEAASAVRAMADPTTPECAQMSLAVFCGRRHGKAFAAREMAEKCYARVTGDIDCAAHGRAVDFRRVTLA